MVPIFLRLTATPGSFKKKLLRVDWTGNIVLIISTTAFLIPITWGGIQFPWNSWQTLVPLLLGLAGIAIFCPYEWLAAVEPTIRLDLLLSYNMAYSLFATFVNALIVYGALYFLPLYYEVVKGYSPIVAGVALFPATFTVAPVSILSGIIITKTGDFRACTWFGWIAATLGCGIMYLLDSNTIVVQWVFLTICAGIGLGLLYTSLSFINQSASDDNDMAFAVSMFVFFRSLGQSVGVAIGGATFQNQFRHHLENIPSFARNASELSINTNMLSQLLSSLPDGVEKLALIQAYADSLKIVWMVMCALSGLALLGSLCVRKKSLDRTHHTEQRLLENNHRD